MTISEVLSNIADAIKVAADEHESKAKRFEDRGNFEGANREMLASITMTELATIFLDESNEVS